MANPTPLQKNHPRQHTSHQKRGASSRPLCKPPVPMSLTACLRSATPVSRQARDFPEPAPACHPGGGPGKFPTALRRCAPAGDSSTRRHRADGKGHRRLHADRDTGRNSRRTRTSWAGRNGLKTTTQDRLAAGLVSFEQSLFRSTLKCSLHSLSEHAPVRRLLPEGPPRLR